MAQYKISGIVWDQSSNQPIPGVRITIQTATGLLTLNSITNTNGLYTLDLSSNWLNQEVRMIFSHENYLTATQTFTVELEEWLRDMKLQRVSSEEESVLIKGWVRDHQGKPVRGAMVELFSIPGVADTTDTNGRYEFQFPKSAGKPFMFEDQIIVIGPAHKITKVNVYTHTSTTKNINLNP